MSSHFIKRILPFLLLFLSLVSVAVAQRPLYKNRTLTPAVRANDLLARMTLDEKIMQLQCVWQQKTSFLTNGDFDEQKAAPLLKNGLGEIARISENKGPSGTGFHPTLPPRDAALLYNKIQRFFVEKTCLGIPVMIHEEGLHGQQAQDATNFPIPLALASSWNEKLMTDIYTNVAEEIRARGGHQVLAPVIDVVRDPRWGRTEETMGEDPYLVSRLGVAQVKAFQGSSLYLDNKHIATCFM